MLACEASEAMIPRGSPRYPRFSDPGSKRALLSPMLRSDADGNLRRLTAVGSLEPSSTDLPQINWICEWIR